SLAGELASGDGPARDQRRSAETARSAHGPHAPVSRLEDARHQEQLDRHVSDRPAIRGVPQGRTGAGSRGSEIDPADPVSRRADLLLSAATAALGLILLAGARSIGQAAGYDR